MFRANIYFVTDISEYKPSPGDLAYPEKLKQMEAIAEEMQYRQLTRYDSTGSLVSSVSEAPSVMSKQSIGMYILCLVLKLLHFSRFLSFKRSFFTN